MTTAFQSLYGSYKSNALWLESSINEASFQLGPDPLCRLSTMEIQRERGSEDR